MPAAIQIDKACRPGFFVFVGNRQGILGASDKPNRAGVSPDKGNVWVCMTSSLAWEQVPAASVIITSETMRGDNDMPLKGKAGPRPGKRKPSKREQAAQKKSPVKSVRKRAKEKAIAGGGTMDLISIDERQIVAIEMAEGHRQRCSALLSAAHTDLEEAEKAVIDAMHRNGFDVKKRPVYTRVPWGSVILQAKGEVVEKVKFTAHAPKKKAKAGEGDPDENEE